MSDQDKLLGIARSFDMKNGINETCRIKTSYSALLGIFEMKNGIEIQRERERERDLEDD